MVRWLIAFERCATYVKEQIGGIVFVCGKVGGPDRALMH